MQSLPLSHGKVTDDGSVGDVCEVAVGQDFTLLLNTIGVVFAVGNNDHAQLGRNHIIKFHPYNRDPIPVPFIGNSNRITNIAAGHGHCAAVAEGGNALGVGLGGKLFMWGWNGNGQCGTGTDVDNVLVATRCDSGALAGADVRVVFVACGGFHTVALTSDGGVIVFGHNFNGQLGTGNYDDQPTPVRLACRALDEVRIVGCAAGGSFTQLVSDDGRVFAMGYNGRGQLGTRDTTRVNTPTEIDAVHFGGAPVAAVACGDQHTLAITRGEGKLYCWGEGADGRTGLGHTDGDTAPQPVVGALADARVVRIAAGLGYSCALVDNGSVYQCGRLEGIGGQAHGVAPAGYDTTGIFKLMHDSDKDDSAPVRALCTGPKARHCMFIEGTPWINPNFHDMFNIIRDAKLNYVKASELIRSARYMKGTYNGKPMDDWTASKQKMMTHIFLTNLDKSLASRWYRQLVDILAWYNKSDKLPAAFPTEMREQAGIEQSVSYKDYRLRVAGGSSKTTNKYLNPEQRCSWQLRPGNRKWGFTGR